MWWKRDVESAATARLNKSRLVREGDFSVEIVSIVDPIENGFTIARAILHCRIVSRIMTATQLRMLLNRSVYLK